MAKTPRIKTSSIPPTVKSAVVTFPFFLENMFLPGMGIDIVLKDIHREAAQQLEDAFLGKMKNADGTPTEWIIINMPPRIGKTLLVCALVAWAFTINPRSWWIYLSYTQTLADDKCVYIAKIMESEWYQKLFDVRFGNIKQANYITTSEGGMLRSAGAEGTVTGFGAGSQKHDAYGCIILDDPQNPNEAGSANMTGKLQDWIIATLLNRRASSKHCPIIIVQQRLSTEDVSGYILRTYPKKTKLIKFPALITKADGTLECVLEPVQSVEDMVSLRDVNPVVFNGQYQQEPILAGGNLVPIDKLMYYTEDPEKYDYEMKVITCDTALTSKVHSDWTVMQCWIKLGQKAYLIDQLRGRWESPKVLQMINAFWKKHSEKGKPVRKIVIEEVGAGIPFIQMLSLAGMPVEAIKRPKDKTARVEDILPYVFNGLVYLPKDAPWLQDLVRELAEFRKDNKHKHDDQVDAFADGITATLARKLTIFDVMGTPKPQGTRGIMENMGLIPRQGGMPPYGIR